MKRIIIALSTIVLIACGGNQSADNPPTDLDRTKNNDTSALVVDSLQLPRKDGSDSSSISR
jgi:hypothetical protein